MWRRSTPTIVGIAVVITVLMTLGVVYAVQTIFQTKEVAATAIILSSGVGLSVSPTTISFGNVLPGSWTSTQFSVNNTSTDANAILFTDARIRFSNTVYPMGLQIGLQTGDAPDIPNQKTLFVGVNNLGHLKLRHLNDHVDTGIAAGTSRIVIVEYLPPDIFPAGTINFDILMDAVDNVE